MPTVINLMDALERGAEKPVKAVAKKWMLPIPGKKPKEAAEPVARSGTKQKKAG